MGALLITLLIMRVVLAGLMWLAQVARSQFHFHQATASQAWSSHQPVGTFNSINFPDKYLNDHIQIFEVEVPGATDITVQFETFELQGPSRYGGCSHDFLEFYEGDGLGGIKLKALYCGNSGKISPHHPGPVPGFSDRHPNPIQVKDNKFFIRFQSDIYVNDMGFNATWNATVSGSWSEWGRWSTCSQTCGTGSSRFRTRSCTNPWPVNSQHDDDDCQGAQSETQMCVEQGLVTSVCPEYCLPGWRRINNKCYKVETEGMTFTKALHHCELTPAASLASISNRVENNQVLSLLRNSRLERVWLGGMKNYKTNTFHWVDHTLWGYQNWHGENNPSNTFGVENCVEMLHKVGGTWNDRNCGEKAPFICSYKREEDITPIELHGGDSYSYGHVFARNTAGFFGPVCDDLWDDRDARVVCRQLGFHNGSAERGSRFGRVPDTFAFDNVRCEGDEDAIQECPHRIVDNCSGTHEGAGVRCS